MTVADNFDRSAEERIGPLLRANLHDGLTLGRLATNDFCFGKEMCKGLFAVQVFAATKCFERVQRMPVIRRRDDDSVEIFLPAQLAKIGVGRTAADGAARFGGGIMR